MPVRILASLCVCLVLVACGHTPIMSIYKLSQLDAATVDIAALRAAVLVPAALRPRVLVGLGAARGGEAHEVRVGAAPHTECCTVMFFFFAFWVCFDIYGLKF